MITAENVVGGSSLFKLFFRLAIFAVVLLGLAVFAGMYNIVRTENGYHLIKKKDFEVSFPMVDTRDWKLRDWVEHGHIRNALGKLKLEDLKDKTVEGWNSISGKIDKWVNENELDTDGAKKELAGIRDEASKRYKKFEKKMKDGKLNSDEFNKKVGELEDWVKKQVDKI